MFLNVLSRSILDAQATLTGQRELMQTGTREVEVRVTLPNTLRLGLLGICSCSSSTGLCKSPAAYARSMLPLPAGMLMALPMTLPDGDCWLGKLP